MITEPHLVKKIINFIYKNKYLSSSVMRVLNWKNVWTGGGMY
jgi:hypothetical protein